MRQKFLRCFTLSEVIIAMGVVGVIAALTVPAMVHNYQQKAYVASIQKFYSELQENITQLQTENYRNKTIYNTNLSSRPDTTATDTVGVFMREYYRINRDCGSTAQPCFASKYYSINGSEINFSCANGYSALLAGDAAVCIIPADIEEDQPAILYVDTNGSEKPNVGGRDMFTFNIYDDFSIDEITPADRKTGNIDTIRNTLFSSNGTSSATGVGCFSRLLGNNWRMDY